MSDLAIFNNNQGQHFNSTIQLESTQDKNRVLRALNMAESLAQAVPAGVPFEICDVFQTPGTRRSRIEGVDDFPCTNTYLLTPDGHAYMSQSDGIARSIDMLLAIYPQCGRDTERGSLTVMVHSKDLPNGNSLKSIVPVD